MIFPGKVHQFTSLNALFFKTDIGTHLLELPGLFLTLLKSFNVGSFHASIFGFPVVIRCLGYAVFLTDVLDRASAFDFLKNMDYLLEKNRVNLAIELICISSETDSCMCHITTAK